MDNILHARTAQSTKKFAYDTILITTIKVFMLSFLIGLLAKVSIPLYFTPVPLTGQTLGIMIAGATLGSRKGALSVLLYLLEGFVGLPVFTQGSLGILALFGPHAGYFLGFIVQAYLVGKLFEKKTLSSNTFKFFYLLSVCSLQLGLGTLVLAMFMHISPLEAIWVGLYPFVLGEIAKVLSLMGGIEILQKISCCKKTSNNQ